ncbi:MAG: alanine--glyoxylate aminotransferase family protein, partial [Acholeplasmataceae bacterium]
VKKHFKLFALKGYESQTVTTVWNTKSLDLKMINERLFERGYLFAPGYGAYKDKAFRIAHMGDRTLEELETYLKEIESLWL